MAIIIHTQSFRQVLAGQTQENGFCPEDQVKLTKNGSYVRGIVSMSGGYSIRIQRYRCPKCKTTYSAIPYDLRPYTAATWALTWLVWISHMRRHRSWRWIEQILTDRGIQHHRRTLQRWQARWRLGLPQIVVRGIQWIATQWGTQTVPVWTDLSWDPTQQWRQLWRRVVAYLQTQDIVANRGGLLAGSVLWGWLPIPFFAESP